MKNIARELRAPVRVSESFDDRVMARRALDAASCAVRLWSRLTTPRTRHRHAAVVGPDRRGHCGCSRCSAPLTRRRRRRAAKPIVAGACRRARRRTAAARAVRPRRAGREEGRGRRRLQRLGCVTRGYQAQHRGGGVWSVTAPVPVGHHRYSFVVDDSVWVADPTAPRVVDNDYGVTNSAIVVRTAGMIGVYAIRARASRSRLCLLAAVRRAQDPRLAARLDKPTLTAVSAIIDSARVAKLPTAPLVDKALEGAAKGSDGAEDRHRRASALRPHGLARSACSARRRRPDEIKAAAAALDAGVSVRDLARIHAAAGKRPVTMPLAVLTDLDRSQSADSHRDECRAAAARSGVRDADLALFQRNVRADIDRGADPTSPRRRGRAASSSERAPHRRSPSE